MIRLEIVEDKKLLIKILPESRDFNAELEAVKGIDGRRYIGETKEWELPYCQLKEVLTVWKEEEILPKDLVTADKIAGFNSSQQSLQQTAGILGPLKFSRELFPFQERYVRLDKSRNRLLLSLIVGAGKTLVSAERAKILGTKKLLVICPKMTKVNWRSELRGVFGKEAIIFYGNTKPQREKLIKRINSENPDIVITTYEKAKELFENSSFKWDQLIIDEAHLLANPSSRRFKDIEVIVKSNPKAGLQLLSGTPIQHKPKDLWALVYLIAPEIAGTYKSWCERYEQVIKSMTKRFPIKNRWGGYVRDSNGEIKYKEVEIPLITKTKNLQELNRRIAPIIYRVTGDEVFNFQEIEEFVTVELTPEQKKLYTKIKEEILVELEEKILTLQHAPVRMLRLLECGEGVFNFDYDSDVSCKLDYINEQIEILEGEPLVIWSRFNAITHKVRDKWPDKAVIYNGDMPDNYKQLAIWAFNGVNDSIELKEYNELLKKVKDFPFGPGEASVFAGVIDLKSSLGINLHKRCRRQIFTSFSFLGVANLQAAARLLRLGQKNETVLTQYLLAEGTIESKALKLVLNNAKVSSEILDGKESLGYKKTQSLIGLLNE